MAAKKTNPAWDFLFGYLKDNRSATYKEVSEAAAKKKYKLAPIMFGRAQALLGIVKSAKRGAGKAAKAKAKAKAAATAKPVAVSAATPVKRGPGRPRKNPAAVAFDGTLESIVAIVRATEQAKARYRGALDKIQVILGDVLR